MHMSGIGASNKSRQTRLLLQHYFLLNRWCECVHDSLHGTLDDGSSIPSSDVHMFLKGWESNVDGTRIQQSMFFFLLSYCLTVLQFHNILPIAIPILISCIIFMKTAVTWLRSDRPPRGDQLTWHGAELSGDLELILH